MYSSKLKQTKMKKIDPYIKLGNLSMTIDNYLTKWAEYAGNTLRVLDFKRDLRSYNTGDTALMPYKTYGCYVYNRYSDDDCIGIYQIWRNAFGLTEVFFFTEDEYNNYNPSDESPLAIKKEIGLCQNYHTGI